MEKKIRKLRLEKETIRDLGDSALKKAVAGQAILTNWFCPSGATWFRDCDPAA